MSPTSTGTIPTPKPGVLTSAALCAWRTSARSLSTFARLRMKSVAPDGSCADASGNVAFHVDAGEGSPWIDGGDGWYYYRGLAGRGGTLDPGAMTESLMDSLRFVDDYHDAARGGSFRLDIDVQAVQAKNQQESDTVLDVLDVVGWPEAN